MRRILRAYVAWERRWGVPLNAFMWRVYSRMFVALGPVAVVFGVLFAVWGYWLGLLMVAIGLCMSWIGWARLLRFARSRLG